MKKCNYCKHWKDSQCRNIDFCQNYSEYEECKEDDKIRPGYYHKGGTDTIQFCIENDLDFLQGNVIKYVVRYKEKNGLEDLKKAKEYLDRIIENTYN